MPLPDCDRVLYRPLPNVQDGGCHLDVYFPESVQQGASCPVAILIHGGSWVMGASTDIQPDSVRYLLDAGVAVISLEYRLAPQVKVQACVEDCLEGYRYVLSGALNQPHVRLGRPSLDVRRTAIVGYSAGASIASCMTVRLPALGVPSPLCVLLFYGMSKLDEGSPNPASAWEELRKVKPKEVAYAEQAYHGEIPASIPIIGQPPTMTPARAFLGLADHLDNLHALIAVPPDSPPDPKRMNFSSYYLVTASFPPTFFSWGEKDTLVPPRQNEYLRDRLVELGVEVQYAIAQDGIHGYAEREFTESRAPDGPWWVQAIQPALDFLIDKTKAVVV